MTDEHKQRIREGKARARLARQQAQPVVDLAAGKDRNEQRAINKDSLERQIEENAAETGIESIDRSKLERRDPEIERHIRRRRDRSSGIPVDNMQPGYRYAWVTIAGPHGESARGNIRQMNADAKAVGYETVEGNMPEAEDFKGNDGMAGTTARGVGDVRLMRIKEEHYQETLAEDRERAERQGIVEDKSVVFARDRLGANVMHNFADDNDRFMTARVDPSLRTPVTMGRAPALNTTHFTEGDIRRGSMKGPNGQNLPPGFERRI